MFKSIKIEQKYLDILNEKIKEEPRKTASGTLWILDKEFVQQFPFVNSDAFVPCSNIFKIGNSYKPHTDVFLPDVQTNLLIPMAAEYDEELSMIIFDQRIEDRGTWVWNTVDDISSYPPKTYTSRPFETEGVEGVTNFPVPDNLKPYLPYEEDYFYGLTGHVMPWNIGEAYSFSARNIHCSSKQSGFKIGCSIRLSCPWHEAFVQPESEYS